MSNKPSDFYISVMDFFAILLPGLLLTFFLLTWKDKVFNDEILPVLNDPTIGWIAYFVVSYFLGHALHHFGNWIDKWFYDGVYVKRKRKNGEEELLKITRGLMKKDLKENHKMTSAFQYAGSYIRIHSNVAKAEIERGGADSKFFRSIFIVLLLIFIKIIIPLLIVPSIIVLVLAGFSLYRYCVLRWKNAQLTYEYFIILHKENLEKIN